jgi:hypothetical protein
VKNILHFAATGREVSNKEQNDSRGNCTGCNSDLYYCSKVVVPFHLFGVWTEFLSRALVQCTWSVHCIEMNLVSEYCWRNDN